MRQTKTLAAIAADIENGENMHEYYNENGAQIKAASKREQTQTGLQYAERERAQLKVKAGQFGTFADFLSYYRQHYRPILEQVADGITPIGDNARLLRLLASDLLDIFKEDSDESEEDTIAIVRVTFSDTENFKRAQRFFDSDGPSQFWAGDWDENARTIEFAEGNDPERLAAALIEEMEREGITGYTWQTDTQRVD